MNDPLLPGPGLPDDPVEQALREALANLSSRDVRPSMIDVQHRVQRRQRRRAAAMVGALAVVVLGAGSVLATRHDRTPLAITAGDGSSVPATTIACIEAVPTTSPVVPDFATTTIDPRVSTTLDPTGIAPSTLPLANIPACGPPLVGQWRCQNPVGTTPDGWNYYQYCEQVFENASTVPVTTVPDTLPSFTYPPADIATSTAGPTTASNP